MVTLTERAVRKFQELLKADPASRGKALRLAVKPGGCSGYEYDIRFDDKRPGDSEIACDGFTVVVDPESAGFLRGSSLDYSESLTGAGFKLLNPNVKGTCGCGKSQSY